MLLLDAKFHQAALVGIPFVMLAAVERRVAFRSTVWVGGTLVRRLGQRRAARRVAHFIAVESEPALCHSTHLGRRGYEHGVMELRQFAKAS